MDQKQEKQKKFVIAAYILLYVFASLVVVLVNVIWGFARLSDSIFIIFMFSLFPVVVIVSIPFMALLFYNRRHQFIKQKVENKAAIIFAITALSVTVLSVAGIEIRHYDLKIYTREKWLEKGYDRGRMIESFMKQVDLVNKTETEVIYYLGEPGYVRTPQGDEEFSFCYSYRLGTYLDWFEGSNFDVYFDETAIVTSVYITSN